MLTFLTSAIEFGVIFLFGCVGEILTEKSGHLNLGIPGIMCMGAAGGCLGVKLCYLASPAPNAFLVVLAGILFAMLFAAALGAVYGFLTVSLRSNQNVTGLACTIFGVGFTSFFLNNAVLTEGVSETSRRQDSTSSTHPCRARRRRAGSAPSFWTTASLCILPSSSP